MFCLSVTHKKGLAHNGNKPVNLQKKKNKVSLNISLIRFLTKYFLFSSVLFPGRTYIYDVYRKFYAVHMFLKWFCSCRKNDVVWITQMPKNRLVNDALFVCALKLRIIFIQCKYFTTLKKKKKIPIFVRLFFFKEKSPTIVVPHLLVLVYLHIGSYLVENSSKRMKHCIFICSNTKMWAASNARHNDVRICNSMCARFFPLPANVFFCWYKSLFFILVTERMCVCD